MAPPPHTTRLNQCSSCRPAGRGGAGTRRVAAATAFAALALLAAAAASAPGEAAADSYAELVAWIEDNGGTVGPVVGSGFSFRLPKQRAKPNCDNNNGGVNSYLPGPGLHWALIVSVSVPEVVVRWDRPGIDLDRWWQVGRAPSAMHIYWRHLLLLPRRQSSNSGIKQA